MRYGWRSPKPPAVPVTDQWGGNVLTLAADPSRSNMLWLALSNEATDPATLLRSIDGGETFVAAIDVANGQPLAGFLLGLTVDPASSLSNRTLYVTKDGQLYRSTNDGVSFAKLPVQPSASGIRVVAAAGNTILAGGEAGLWLSINSGASWTQQDSAKFSVGQAATIDMQWKGVHSVLINNGIFFACYYNAGTSGKGLFRSDDSGATWTSELMGLGSADRYSRCIVGDDAGNLYHASGKAAKAGQNASLTGATGVRRYKVETTAWSSLMAGTSWPEAAWPLAVHPMGAYLIAGFPGQGFQRLLGPVQA
jgi:hypothetical protein